MVAVYYSITKQEVVRETTPRGAGERVDRGHQQQPSEKDNTMQGFITKKEVEDNQELIAEQFGQEFLEACLTADEGTTFLGLLMEHGKL